MGLSDDPNIYIFGNNNPSNYLDFYGLKKCPKKKNCNTVFWLCMLDKGVGLIPVVGAIKEFASSEDFDFMDLSAASGETLNKYSKIYEGKAWTHGTGQAPHFRELDLMQKKGLRYPKKSSIWRRLNKMGKFLKKASIALDVFSTSADMLECWSRKLDCEMNNLYK